MLQAHPVPSKLYNCAHVVYMLHILSTRKQNLQYISPIFIATKLYSLLDRLIISNPKLLLGLK